jgi:hypothetical protein
MGILIVCTLQKYYLVGYVKEELMGWRYNNLRSDEKYMQNWQRSASYLARFLLRRQSREMPKQLRRLQFFTNIPYKGYITRYKCSKEINALLMTLKLAY